MRVYHYLVVKNLGAFLLVKPPVVRYAAPVKVALSEPWWKTVVRYVAACLDLEMEPPPKIQFPSGNHPPKIDLYFRADGPDVVQWTRQMMKLGAKFDGEIATLISSAVSDRDMTPIMTLRGGLITKTANTADGFAVRIVCDVVD